ncbi:MAG: flagellar biosynthesis regulator FlaF [Thermomicrobiales bacterium]
MQTLRYSEMLEDDQKQARERERIALDRSIELMDLASQDSASPADVASAIVFTNKLWAVLIEDLAAPENGLPAELRAQLVSIGIWVMREMENIRNSEQKDFADVIQVSRAIRDGLL